jgi:hypothetical protein
MKPVTGTQTYGVTVYLLLDVQSEGAAADYVNETLREFARIHDIHPQSALVDYGVGEIREAPEQLDLLVQAGTYQEGLLFNNNYVGEEFWA